MSQDPANGFILLQIGSTCMVVLEHEMKRHKSLQDDLTVKKKSGRFRDSMLVIVLWYSVRTQSRVTMVLHLPKARKSTR